ncbi:MAG: TRAP transporter small permease subunit [Clostridiales bacterium]|nr:TRAP transporter small permease subunit [Clostridiales bacterium]
MKKLNCITEKYRKISDAYGIIGAVGLFLMVALTFIDVFMRYFFKNPITGSQEMMQFLMIITMYGAMAISAGNGMLLTVDAFTRKFNPTLRKFLRMIFTIMCTICAILMCEKMFEQFWYYVQNPLQRSSILKWSYAPFYFFAGVGLLLLSIELILEILLCIAALRSRTEAVCEKEESADD